MPDKMNGENHSLVRLFLKSGFMKELDLTKGSVLKTLLQFAVPFLIANLLQALYGGADLFVVGGFDDAASVAAVAIGSQVMQTIKGIILGLTTGTTVVIAMATGAKNYRDVATSIGTSICLFASVGLFLTLIMVVFHNYIAVLMHTPVEAMRDAKHYLLICSIGIPFIMGYNVVCGILRGLGDSKTPLYFVALACVINIVLDVVLVGFCHLRAAGAAIATASSQGISFLTALWRAKRSVSLLAISVKISSLSSFLIASVLTILSLSSKAIFSSKASLFNLFTKSKRISAVWELSAISSNNLGFTILLKRTFLTFVFSSFFILF